MIIVDKETLETFNEIEVAAMFPHIGFDFSDAEIVGEVLETLGMAVVNMPTQPVFDSRYQVATEANVVESDGGYSGEWILSDAELTSEQRAELIADKRYTVETGGMFAMGVQIPTDRHTQQVLTAMYMRALADTEYTIRFKTGAGFVDMSSAQIIDLAEAVHDHVQAAFAREDELLTAIENGDLITPDDWA